MVFSVSIVGLLMVGLVLLLPSRPIYGLFFILVLAFLASAALMALRPGATYVAIDRNGVTRSISLQKNFVGWSEIQSIRVGWVGYEAFNIAWNRQLFIDYRQNDQDGLLASFPHAFGVNAEELMNLLAPYYEHAQKNGGMAELAIGGQAT